MAYFKDDQEVYAYIGKLFEDLAVDPELAPKFRKADTIVPVPVPESRVADHRASSKAEGEPGRPRSDRHGARGRHEHGGRHRPPFWLGKVNVTVALARGQIKAKGPVAKILKLVPLVKPVFPRYKQQLEQQGRTDLAQAG